MKAFGLDRMNDHLGIQWIAKEEERQWRRLHDKLRTRIAGRERLQGEQNTVLEEIESEQRSTHQEGLLVPQLLRHKIILGRAEAQIDVVAHHIVEIDKEGHPLLLPQVP